MVLLSLLLRYSLTLSHYFSTALKFSAALGIAAIQTSHAAVHQDDGFGLAFGAQAGA